MVGAGNDRNAFSRRCMDSPRRVIDEQHRAVDHDEFGPCRCHMGLGQRRGDVGGVERGCSASWRGGSGNPWTVWRDEPKLRDQTLANRSHIRKRDTGCRRTAAGQIGRAGEFAVMVVEVIAGCTRAVVAPDRCSFLRACSTASDSESTVRQVEDCCFWDVYRRMPSAVGIRVARVLTASLPVGSQPAAPHPYASAHTVSLR